MGQGFHAFRHGLELLRGQPEALAQLARALRLPPNALGFAGTKDKRAVTAQRVTAFKVTAERLRQLMAAAPFGESIVVGDDLTYDEEPLRLGALVHKKTATAVALTSVVAVFFSSRLIGVAAAAAAATSTTG